MDRSDIPQPVVPDSPRQPGPHDPRRGLGPPHLRIVEVDFLKPTTRNKEARTVAEDSKPAGNAPVGDWE
jgi:hypothetical protein